MFNVFIDKTVRCAGRSATSLVSYNKVGVRVARRSSQGFPIFMEGNSIHSEIVKQAVYYGKSVNGANRSSQGISCFQIHSHLVGLLP